MTITPDQIDLWRGVDSEDERLEFKEAKRQYDFAKLCKYCVALANEGGGHMLFGISDKPPRPIVGTQAVRDPTGMTEKLFRKLGFRVDVFEVSHSDGRVVVFRIPSRPAGGAYNLDGAFWMRSGGSIVAMSEDRLRSIFSEGEVGGMSETGAELSAKTHKRLGNKRDLVITNSGKAAAHNVTFTINGDPYYKSWLNARTPIENFTIGAGSETTFSFEVFSTTPDVFQIVLMWNDEAENEHRYETTLAC